MNRNSWEKSCGMFINGCNTYELFFKADRFEQFTFWNLRGTVV